MFTQSQWIDLYKAYADIRIEYRLAVEWGLESIRITQYQRNRLRLTFAQCIKITDILEINEHWRAYDCQSG